MRVTECNPPVQLAWQYLMSRQRYALVIQIGDLKQVMHAAIPEMGGNEAQH
jgi:hypothetical protein